MSTQYRISEWVRIETCPLRPEENGTERPLQYQADVVRFACVAAARILGGHFLFRSYPPRRLILGHQPPLVVL